MGYRKERPGVLLYFDAIRPALKRLDDQQCGALLRAVVEYAEKGTMPNLDPMTGMAFDLLAPKIDRDAERYEESREQRQYAVYCREKQKSGEPCMKISEWRLSKFRPPDENIGPMFSDNGENGSYPPATISPSATGTISPATTGIISPSAAGAGEEAEEGCKGEGEGEQTPATLQANWAREMAAGNRAKALEISNRLFCLGYKIDLNSGELSRRN